MADTIRKHPIASILVPFLGTAFFAAIFAAGLWLGIFYICWNMVESMICHAKCDPAASKEVFYIIGAVFSSAIVAAIVTIILIMPAFLIMKYSLKQLRKMNKTK